MHSLLCTIRHQTAVSVYSQSRAFVPVMQHFQRKIHHTLPLHYTSNESDSVAELQHMLREEDKRFIVLDDDPTGCQTVHDVNVLLNFDVESLCEQLILDEKCFYILTNSRSMNERDAVAVTSLVLDNIKEACDRTNYSKPISFISRGDSCLRGHYPAEVDTIKTFMRKSMADTNKIVTIMMPAFIEGGRITKDSVHYVKEGDSLIPVGNTPFALDPHFSFKSSNLCDYVVEKTSGRITASQVKRVTLDDMRSVDVTTAIRNIVNILQSCDNEDVVVVDLEVPSDMVTFMLALLKCEQKHQEFTFVYRTAASFVATRCGIAQKPLLSENDIISSTSSNHGTGGLIVVGSYVPKTTAQLAVLSQTMNIHAMEFDVLFFQILRANSHKLATAMVESLSQQINKLLLSGRHVVLYTSRREIITSHNEPADGIDEFTAISDALTAVVSGLEVVPAFLIAKGGITSHEVAHKGLNVSKARVVGQVTAGVPVWKTTAGSKFPGLHYIVFPGNVGSNETLALVAEQLGVSRYLAHSAALENSPRVVAPIPWSQEIKNKNRTFKILEAARQDGYAIAAFNVYNLEGAKAAINAAEELGMSVLLQVHPSSLQFGGRELMTMLCSFRKYATVPVGVHLDHSTREEDVRLALDCGVDSIMVDGSHLPLHENIAFTKRMVQLAHARGVVVEAELGRLAGEEDGLSVSEKEAKMTDPDKVEYFLTETQVDLLAVTIGNVHGKYKHPPALDFTRMAAIRAATRQAAVTMGGSPCILVLHGASGLPNDIIATVVEGGVCKFNVNTDLRGAAVSSMKKAFVEGDNIQTSVDILDLMKGSYEAMKGVARQKITAFRLTQDK